MMKPLPLLPASLLALVMPAIAVQLPYNPTSLISSSNGSLVYIFSPDPDSSQASLSYYNTSETLGASTSPQPLYTALPFLKGSESRPFLPILHRDGISVLTGNCGDDTDGAELWQFELDVATRNGSWTKQEISTADNSLTANFLSAGTATLNDNGSVLYVFGGMCPTTDSSQSDWISEATYSAKMLSLTSSAANGASKDYTLSSTGARAPPIPEAGLTMTSLTSMGGASEASQQQNFVLIGGHTQNAFINMSQVAMFSLPQASWAFLPVQQPQSNENTELVRRDAVIVEPRSGHTAVLTQDGTRIIVIGGWVGDTSTPAQPQVAVLNIGEDYGGKGDWAWSVPTSSNPYGANGGIYGHGAALLQNDTLMITGGFPIGTTGSKAKRQANNNLHFLNVTSMLWSTSYSHPSSASAPNAHSEQSSSGLNSTEKIGLGAGLGVSLAAVAVIVSVWFWYTRRLRQQRYLREKELRELALGAERSIDPTIGGASDQRYPGRNSGGWPNMQEKTMGSLGRVLPWNTAQVDDLRNAERTGVQMDVPSPTRGLRKNLQTRGQFGAYMPGAPTGSVFRIDEEEENSQSGSLRRTRAPQQVVDRTSTYSDPFKDPPRTADSSDDPAEQRKREVQSWVEDWQSAAESILSRNPSQAQTNRTYSTLSQAHAGGNLPSGRGSPEKSDRTGSNLSESSAYSQLSFQRSVAGTVSRKESQRSASASQMMLGGVAAGMGRVRGQQDGAGPGVSREASRRSVSMRDYMTAGRQASMREHGDTYSNARNSTGVLFADENRALLGKLNTHLAYGDDESTPPTSPVKEVKYTRASSLTRTGAKAMGFLGSVKRVITGTGGVSVHDRVNALENKSGSASPTKTDREESPKRPLSPSQEFWKGKQGAKDWNDPSKSTGTVRRKPLPGQATAHDQDDAGEWDVETAVNSRVVQVMFTVPKEKLRVVNADALSLLSSNRSDVDHEEEKDREKEIKRMSSVREADESDGRGKGKGPNMI